MDKNNTNIMKQQTQQYKKKQTKISKWSVHAVRRVEQLSQT